MKSRNAILEKPKLRRRRRRQVVSVVVGLIIVALLVSLGWIATTSKLMISSVKVSGAVAVSPAEVKNLVETVLAGKYFYIFPKRHIFWYPQQELEKKLSEQFSRIDSINISRQGFNEIEVKVKERMPLVLVCAERCFFADRSGLVYAVAPTFSKPVYLIWDTGSSTPSVGSKVGEPGAFDFIELIAGYFDEVFAGRGLGNWQATRVVSLAEGDYKIVFSEAETGKTLPVLVANSEAPTSSAKNLDLALGQILGTSTPRLLPSLEYLDLRFGKKVFYKL